ncbi:hypothetical protein RND81_06G121100 [Saponaria officinalis]|uniref:Protein kinase domain-containing protein n=1 Tax=Saponaria officinalis TaxID=3572 RepID=A0AAW1K949_SAPOF
MSNKTLDAVIFDPDQRQVLDWQKRFSFIRGICRGLLYLYSDSRVRIIHRDLKPSNILLDEELNPKISVFGMSRSDDSKQDPANTMTLVQTYGYIATDYALKHPLFEKADVFGFGVLLLQIVSGERNHRLSDQEHFCIISYVWHAWKQTDMLSLIDPTILNQCFERQIFKCIQVGLLCIQLRPEDRPEFSALIYMLDNVDNIETLPIPKQPDYTGSGLFSDRISQGRPRTWLRKWCF